MAVIVTHIQDDEWWLKPEQHPSETRDEWKNRTFAMHYGRQINKFSSSLLQSTSPIDEAEADKLYEDFIARFPGVSEFVKKGIRDVDNG